MKRRIVILLAVLGAVATACGGTNSDGPGGINRVATTTTSMPVAEGSGIVEPCEAPEDLTAYCQPFTYEQGSLRIVWDRWFWGQGMFSRGTVEIYDGSALIRSGPFSDPSVMRQESNADLTFLDENGAAITVVTQLELKPIIEAAQAAAGIGGDPS